MRQPQIIPTVEEKALDLDVRRKLYRLVEKYAGTHFRELERKSGLSTGSLNYHLSYLTSHSLIRANRGGENLRYYPIKFEPENEELMGLLRQKSLRNILLFILTNENCTHKEIVRAVRLSPSTTSWHLKRLEEQGVVVSKRHGRVKNYVLLIDKPRLVNLLITYKESFLDSLVDRVVEMWSAD